MDYSGPTELHFYRYMSDLLSRHPDYSDIVLEALISPTSRYRADIIAYGKKGRRKEKLVIECKSFSVLDDARLAPVLARLTDTLKSSVMRTLY